MNDLISRQDAIEALEEKKGKTAKGNIGRFYNTIIQHDIDALMDLPSAQPERKGKWIRITQGAIPEKYMCPFCHSMVEHEGVEYFVSMMYPFCHCGADMRGEEE